MLLKVLHGHVLRRLGCSHLEFLVKSVLKEDAGSHDETNNPSSATLPDLQDTTHIKAFKGVRRSL